MVHVDGEITDLVESIPHRKLKLLRRLMGHGIHMHNVLRGVLERDAIGDAFGGTPEGGLLRRQCASEKN